MRNILDALMYVGGIMCIVGIATYSIKWEYSPYIYTIGAVMYALYIINTPLSVTNSVIKRLRVQQIFGAIALVLTSLFMFTTRGNEWLACLMIAAFLLFYTAMRLPYEIKKEEKK